MNESFLRDLSRRERQIMDVLYSRGACATAEVREHMPDAPSYSAVRAMLRVLEDKGHIEHFEDGPRYVYRPCVAREEARQNALRHLVTTFFDGSREAVVSALLDDGETIDGDEFERLSELVELARHKEEKG